MGDLCNQSCLHCHIDASPSGKKIMSRKVADDILGFLKSHKIQTLDITGGAPELNPNFDYLVTSARRLVDELIVRSNLSVFFEPQKEYLPGFFKGNRVHLVCSLPCYMRENVEKQRGQGVFQKSIDALRILNKLGFSKEEGLALDLVYNPAGANLPPGQGGLEKEYKRNLRDSYGIEFNRLLTITNVPIKKFKRYLESSNEYDKYYSLLEKSFNPDTLENLMCRSFLSVGYDGMLYDCDFNLALGLSLQDKSGNQLTIDKLNPHDLDGRQISIDQHCLSCTAGSGSSCQGALGAENICSNPAVKADKKETVKEYYGKVLQNKNDLKTSACCAVDSYPEPIKSIIEIIEPEILDKFYGCGCPIPPLLEGARILDLGSGTGRDVYIASYLAGEHGFATGIDMTDEQLEVARRYTDTQMKRFGFKSSNVEFKKGYIEDLKGAGIEDNLQDLVISNCVINLSPDKGSVFKEIFRVLKPGGELYFSDVFAGSRIPEQIKDDPLLYGECLGGAMYIEDFRRLLASLGIPDYRVLSKRKFTISDSKVASKVGNIEFFSMTVRAFKLNDLEDICEDYGQVVYYQGTIPQHPHQFILDDHHTFIAHKPMLACGNTVSMLSNTRFAGHFRVIGDRSRHFGAFPCAPASELTDREGLNSGGGGCC